MNHPVGLWIVAVAAMGWLAGTASAQPAAKRPAAKPAARAPAATTPAAKPAAGAAAAKPSGGDWINPGMPFRKLASGVLQPVTPTPREGETVEKHDVTELLYVDPNFDFAKDVSFHRDIWMLEIQFKPMRMIWADLPGPQGRFERKLIWYMVYKVTNPGKVLHPIEVQMDEKRKLWNLTTVDKPVRFVPVFTLEVHNQLQNEAAGSAKVYSEKYIPIVLPAIRAREDKNRDFLPTVQMPAKEIGPGETVWGVATWVDIDPRNVWFSVYVEGLTSAYFWKDDLAKFAAVTKGTEKGPYRELFGKALKINFWRPGDEYLLKENQVRLGIPGQANGPPPQPPYEWIWRRVL